MNRDAVCAVLSEMRRRMEEQKEFLTDLDNAIADGDHGINMAKGFAAMEQKLTQIGGQDIGALLKAVGMALVSSVGGSAGPLYGTAFMKAGMVTAGKSEVDINDLIACLRAAVEGVMQRGHATRGEKTMLDAMIPALEGMERSAEAGLSAKAVADAGVAAAKQGVEYTKTIAATKGRASYIGERSIGHQDPGATSFTILLGAIADAL